MSFHAVELTSQPNTLVLGPSLGSDVISQILSADLLEVIDEDVDTRIWCENGGATLQGAINLFADHWITFDLRSFLLSRMPPAGERLRREDRAELHAQAAFLRRVAEEIEAAAQEPGLTDAEPLAVWNAA
jgi:hypothetical protein